MANSVLTIPIGDKEYPMPATEKALLKVGKLWRKNARISLKMQGRINTGKLYNSMPVEVIENDLEYLVDITPVDAPYWKFVDKGVQGASRNIYREQNKSPFKFGSGQGGKGLRGAIDKWVVQKGIQGTRDSLGRFTSRKQISFAIARAVWHRGLKPTLFITGTYKRIKKHIVKTIAPAISSDVANAMREELN